MEHCIKIEEIARLDERTRSFSRQLDEISGSLDKLNEKIDYKFDMLTAQLEKIRINSMIEKTENKWKHRFNILLGGALGGGGMTGIIKLITLLFE